ARNAAFPLLSEGTNCRTVAIAAVSAGMRAAKPVGGAVGSTSDPSDKPPLQAFTGDISPTPISVFYKAALAAVAFAMMLLPAVYLAIIVLIAWGVAYHLQHNVELFEHGVFARIMGYLGPAVV